MNVSPPLRRFLLGLLVGLVVLAVETPGLAAACPPDEAVRPHCPLMSARLCSGPAAAQTSAVEREPGNCCRGSRPAAKVPEAFVLPLQSPAVPAVFAVAVPTPALGPQPRSTAAPSPRPALYTLFRSLLI